MNNSLCSSAQQARRSLPFSWILLLGLPLSAPAQFNYAINNGAITITGYTGSGGAVTLPGTIAGLPVVSIANSAFSYCSSLSSITVGNSITNIGSDAFYWCTGLTNIALGRSVQNIGASVFDGCSQLTAIMVEPLNTAYTSIDGVLFNKAMTVLLQCPEGKAGSYVVPGTVTSIANGAFYFCAGLTQVDVGNEVTDIGIDAFLLCTGLNSVTLGNGLETIGQEAFRGSGLRNITIPASVISIGLFAFASCDSLATITVNAFNPFYSSLGGVLFDKNQTTLLQWPGGKAPEYTIPSGVSSIGTGAFYYCSALTSITIANDVGNIGPYAFELCGRLTNVLIGSRVTSIGDSAFNYCNLISVCFMGNAPTLGMGVFDNDFYATAYYLPGSVGWGPTFGGLPAAPWVLPNPVILTTGPSFGVETNRFGFVASWAEHDAVVIEACDSVANPTWSTLATNALAGGWCYFGDPDWTNQPRRFYRLRQ